MKIEKGEKVFHKKFGEGIVVGARNNYFDTYVYFKKLNQYKWIRTSYLEFPNKKKFKKVISKLISKEQKNQSENFKLRRIIEAFKLGIVPYDLIHRFMYGREKEIQEVFDWLNNDEEGALIVIGEYGSGKTHFLHYILNIALESDFAVSWVDIDPNETPFFKPKSIYGSFIKNFKYKDKNEKIGNFRDFLKKCLIKGAFEDNEYFSFLKDYNSEIFWEWIEAKESKLCRPIEYEINKWGYEENKYKFLPGLYDYQNAANIYCYLLSSIGWATKEVMDLKGLLLIFDESEAINIKDTTYRNEKSKNFIRAIIRTASNDKTLLEPPYKTDLDYCGIGKSKEIPFLYKEKSNLKLLFAFTELDWNYYEIHTFSDRKIITKEVPIIKELDEIQMIELESLSKKELLKILKEIYEIYKKVFNFSKNINIQDLFSKIYSLETHTRLFIKAAIEKLDLIRLRNYYD